MQVEVFRVTKDTHKKLKELTRKNKTTISGLLRAIVEDYLTVVDYKQK